MTANTGWNLWRADASPGFSLHKLLNDAVFEGVIANNYQSTFKPKQVNCLSQGCFQVLKFMINSYP